MNKILLKAVSSVLAVSMLATASMLPQTYNLSVLSTTTASAASNSYLPMTANDVKITMTKMTVPNGQTPTFTFNHKTEDAKRVFTSNVMNSQKLAFYDVTMVVSGYTSVEKLMQSELRLKTHASKSGAVTATSCCYGRNNLEVTNMGNRTYKLVWKKIMAFGDYASFELVTDTDALYVTNATMNCSGNRNFYVVKSVCNGENIYANVPYDSTIPMVNYQNWAKRICLYANSLKDVTGLSNGTVYLSFDYSSMPDGAGAYFFRHEVERDGENPAFVTFGDFSNNVFEQIRNNTNTIEWVEMHEIGHAYGDTEACNSRFERDYQYHDEVFTNVRGITALQNCKALRSVKVVNSDFQAPANYAGIMNNFNGNADSDPLMTMVQTYAAIGNLFGWNILEEAIKMNGSISVNYKELGNASAIFGAKTNMSAAEMRKTNLMQFVASLLCLYKSFANCTGNTNHTFESFCERMFGWKLLGNFAKTLFTCDLNDDGKTNSADYTILLNYLRGTAQLNAAQMEQADINQDGTINIVDLIRIKELVLE